MTGEFVSSCAMGNSCLRCVSCRRRLAAPWLGPRCGCSTTAGRSLGHRVPPARTAAVDFARRSLGSVSSAAWTGTIPIDRGSSGPANKAPRPTTVVETAIPAERRKARAAPLMARYWPVLTVNPGRPPTPIGSDGIDPWLRVEDWVALVIVDMLKSKGIACRVRRDGRCEDERGIAVPMDRISFPGGDARRLQRIFESWIPDIE